MTQPLITNRPSDWRIVTSSGLSAGKTFIVVSGGLTAGRLYISKNSKAIANSPGVVVLSYAGAGLGISLGPSPVDLSASDSEMPSGGHIYHGPLSNGADIELADLTGICVIRVHSASLAATGSLTKIFFRPVITAIPVLCKAVGFVLGVSVSTSPGFSIIDYPCYMRISHVNPETLESKEPHEPANVRSRNFQVIPPALTLPADVLFDFDRAELKPAADSSLQAAVQLIARQRVGSVIIEGHTDSKGTHQYNLGLSNARANAVKNWFVRHQVPNASSFVTTGMGKSQPIAPNTKPDGSDNPEGRRQNRRVCIILVP